MRMFEMRDPDSSLVARFQETAVHLNKVWQAAESKDLRYVATTMT